MGFWIFMLATNLLIPLAMIAVGLIFGKGAPKEINGVYGYRTARSMKNKETWEFAHRVCAKIWRRAGLILLPCSLIFMLPLIGREEDIVGGYSLILCVVQLLVMIGSIFPVEAALRRTFDENGRRKQE